jgi:zinc protease
MKRFCRASCPALVLLSLFCLNSLNPGVRAEDEAKPKKVVSIEGITEYQLDNGLKVLLYPDPSSSRVTVNMTVLVGSRHEGYGETGMAHLLEHMVFKGTPTHPDVPKALRDHGANFNGTTWLDRTNYFETMKAEDKNLEFAIRLEADRLVNSFVKREDLASEMTVVRNEFESGENNPSGILFQRMMSTAFEWHNYGKSTIGNRSDIERVPIDRLQAFYRKYYQPDNVVLIIAGNFDEAKALGYIGKYFGVLKKPARQLETTYTEEPAQDGEREVTLRRVGKVAAVGAVYHIPSGSHEDYPACEVLVNVLDHEPSGRLYKALVATKKATNVGASSFALHDPGALIVMADVESKESKEIQEVRDILLDIMEKAGDEAFTEEEVERVKRKLLKDRELQMNDVNRIGITLSEWASKGDWRLFFLHRDRLEKVKPADVNRVAKAYLKRTNRTAGVYFPTTETQRTPVPQPPDVVALLKGYQGRKAISAGESFDPTPENVEARVKRPVLPSGVKTALLAKKTRGEIANLRLTLRFGNDQSLKRWTTTAEFVGPLMRRGTKDMTRQQLDDELDKLKARVTIASDAGVLTVNVECKRENLPAVLKLVGKMLREPSFPADEFDVLKRQTLKQLEEGLAEPQQLAQRALRRAVSTTDKDDVTYTPTIEEDIERTKAVTLDKVKQLYREQIGGQHGELVVVGDFDMDPTVKQVTDILDGWKTETPYKRVARKAYPDRKPEKPIINTPDKANAIYLAVSSYAMLDTDPDYPALQVGNYLLGAAPLASRLSKRVRGKDGLSYGVGSQFQASSQDPVGMFLIFAIYNPVNIDKVDSAIEDEITKIVKDGVEEKELKEGVEAYLQSQKNQRATDSGLLGQLASALQVGRTMEFHAQREKAIAELSAERVNAALKKHIDPKRLTIIRAGDFKKKAE